MYICNLVHTSSQYIYLPNDLPSTYVCTLSSSKPIILRILLRKTAVAGQEEALCGRSAPAPALFPGSRRPETVL